MPITVTRRDVRALVTDGAQLVEVLARPEFDAEHLPKALHLPLKELDARAAEILDPARPIIVYCWDAL